MSKISIKLKLTNLKFLILLNISFIEIKNTKLFKKRSNRGEIDVYELFTVCNFYEIFRYKRTTINKNIRKQYYRKQSHTLLSIKLVDKFKILNNLK